MRKLFSVLVMVALVASFGCSSGSDGGSKDSSSPDDTADTSQDTGTEDLGDDLTGLDSLEETSDPLDVVEDIEPDLDDVVVPPDTNEISDAVEVEDAADVEDLADLQDLADTETDTVQPPDPYFPSAELGIKIVGPSATGSAQSLGSLIQLAGLVAGEPESIEWTTGEGQQGYAQGMPFWLSTTITLKNGDNRITVTAKKGDEVATDSIVITYNPGFLFGSRLQLWPGVIFVGTTSSVIFRVDMSQYGNFEPSTLTLCEATPEGLCVTDIHAMVDNGQVGSSGDEVASDAIYSWKKSYSPQTPGKICFRAKAVVKAGYQQYTAMSPVECLEVVPRIVQQTCTDTKSLLEEAEAAARAVSTGDADAQQAALDLLLASPLVTEAGVAQGGTGVWVRFAAGFLGAIELSQEGTRGGTLDYTATPPTFDYAALDPNLEGMDWALNQMETFKAPPLAAGAEVRISSKRTITLAPYNTEFASKDEALAIHSTLVNSTCPAYSTEGPFKGNLATLARFRAMSNYGVITITSHGDTLFKDLSQEAREPYAWTGAASQEIIWTGEEVNCSNFVQTSPSCSGPTGCPAGSECIITEANVNSTSVSGVCVDFKQADLLAGRVAMGAKTFAILPSFVEKYQGTGLPNSLVYLGTCKSMWNGTMAMEFYGAGARSVVGYTGTVSNEFAFEKGSAYVKQLVESGTFSGPAMPPSSDKDPAFPDTSMRLLGASNLNIANADLINTSFETGDITGWQKTGDGRVISQLGITIPVEGKFMALISTGLGFTPQVGEIYQSFCVPPEKMKMSFYWKYYSEEFKEFCGSSYQDTFEATLESDDGLITFVNVTVDDLCPPDECMGCGSKYEGLLKSDVSFDQGDSWNTQWRKAESNIMAMAGKGAATLRFFATDKGDSIYDTVILIDAIKIQ